MLTSVGYDSSIYSATPRSHRTEPQQFNVDPIDIIQTISCETRSTGDAQQFDVCPLDIV